MLKKISILLLVLLALIVMALTIFAKPALIAFAKAKIEHAIPGSTISVEEINLYYSPWSLLLQKAHGAGPRPRTRRHQESASGVEAMTDVTSLRAMLP